MHKRLIEDLRGLAESERELAYEYFLRTDTPFARTMDAAADAIEKLQAERDAFFEEVRGYCHTCKHNKTDFDCHLKCYGHQRGSAWEWRGSEGN